MGLRPTFHRLNPVPQEKPSLSSMKIQYQQQCLKTTQAYKYAAAGGMTWAYVRIVTYVLNLKTKCTECFQTFCGKEVTVYETELVLKTADRK